MGMYCQRGRQRLAIEPRGYPAAFATVNPNDGLNVSIRLSMQELYLPLHDCTLHVRHRFAGHGRPTILFIHGLGESGLCFEDAFKQTALDDFNLLVPDLAGYGRSSSAASYSFHAQLDRIRRLVDHFYTEPLHVVGHSLGSDLAILACQSVVPQAASLTILEGHLTFSGVFIANRAVAAYERGEFDEWWTHGFRDTIVYEQWGAHSLATRGYYASLRFARPQAMLENSLELVRRREFGDVYCALTMPKLFCYGSQSVTEPTLEFLAAHNLESRKFEGAHWFMLDQPSEFYQSLAAFLAAASPLQPHGS